MGVRENKNKNGIESAGWNNRCVSTSLHSESGEPVFGDHAFRGTGPWTNGEPVRFIFSRCQVSICIGVN